MRRSDQFFVPNRQSQYAIIFIVLRFLKKTLRQVWPILIAILLGRGSSFDLFEIGIAGLGVFGMIASVLSYFKFYYSLSEDELIISKGIFRKVNLNIPFERIQSVNFRQNVVHQFFQVTEVEIETAGSAGQETKIDALSIEIANELREKILERKASLAPGETEQTLDVRETISPKKESIIKLSNQDLLRVGLTQNHLRPIGLIISLLSSLIGYSYAVDYSGGLASEIFDFFKQLYSNGLEVFLEISVFQAVSFVFILALISVLYSLVTTFLRYYNLDLYRINEKFLCEQGLITRREFAALDNKIQILTWGQNIFQKLIGLYNVHFKQARSSDQSRKQMRFIIPGCSKEKVDELLYSWLDEQVKFEAYYNVSIHYFIRRATYGSFFMLLILVPVFMVYPFSIGVLLLILFLFWFYMQWLRYKKKKFALNDQHLYIGGGVFNQSHALLPFYKIQNLSVRQNYYQQRRGLASLHIITAGGTLSIPYIDYGMAENLLDLFTYHVEISKRAWM